MLSRSCLKCLNVIKYRITYVNVILFVLYWLGHGEPIYIIFECTQMCNVNPMCETWSLFSNDPVIKNWLISS